MSESQSPSIPKSSLNDLRQFRINKNAAATASPGRTGRHCVFIENVFLVLCVENAALQNVRFSERVPGKKRIQVMADSDSDGADSQTPKKIKIQLTVKEKEERYMAAAKIMPNYDTMVSIPFGVVVVARASVSARG